MQTLGEGLCCRGERFYVVQGRGRRHTWIVPGSVAQGNGHPSACSCSCSCSYSWESSAKRMKMKKMPSFSLIARTAASTSWPDDAKEVESDTSMVKVKFVLERKCQFGEQFRVVGEDALLGTWDPEAALAMEWSEGHVWTVELEVPAGKRIEYKFVLKGGEDGEPQWQPGSNQVLDTFNVNEEQMIVMGLWDDEEESLADYQQGLIEEDKSFLEGVSENGCDLGVAIISHNNTALVPEAEIEHIDANKQIPSIDVVAIDEQVLPSDINGKSTNIEIIVYPNDTLKVEGGSSTFEAEIKHIDANKSVPSMDVVAIDKEVLQLDINAESTNIEIVVDPNDTLKLEGGSSTLEAEIEHIDANKPVHSMDVVAIDEQVLQLDINTEPSSIEIAVDPNDTLKVKENSEERDQDDFLNQDVSDNNAKESSEPPPNPSVVENDLDWGRKAFRNLFRAFGGDSWQNES